MLQRRPGSDLPLRGTLIGGIALIAASGLLAAGDLGGRGLLALGAILVAIVVLSYPIRNVRRVADPARATFGWAGAPAVLASLPLTLLGLAAVRAAVFELVYAQHLEYLGLIAIGLLLQALGWAVYFLAFRRAPTEDQTAAEAPSIVPLYAAGVVVAFIAAGVWLDPWRAGNVLGTIGALAAFLLGIALLGYAALTLERRWLSPPVFLVVGIKRFPVFLILLAWAIAAAALDPGGFHDVRTIDRRGGGPGDARRRVAALARASAASATRSRSCSSRRKAAGSARRTGPPAPSTARSTRTTRAAASFPKAIPATRARCSRRAASPAAASASSRTTRPFAAANRATGPTCGSATTSSRRRARGCSSPTCRTR